MDEKKCQTCGERYSPDRFVGADCVFCARNKRFAAFAESCVLTTYPDPSGERYMYDLDGECAGKKSECVDVITKLWNALVRVKGGDDDLIVP